MKKQIKILKNNLTKNQRWDTVYCYETYPFTPSIFYEFGRITSLLRSRLKYFGESSSRMCRIKPEAKLAWCLRPFTKAS